MISRPEFDLLGAPLWASNWSVAIAREVQLIERGGEDHGTLDPAQLEGRLLLPAQRAGERVSE